MSAMARITQEIALTTAVLAVSVVAFTRRMHPAVTPEEEAALGVEAQGNKAEAHGNKAVGKATKHEGEEDALARPML